MKTLERGKREKEKRQTQGKRDKPKERLVNLLKKNKNRKKKAY